MTRSLASDPSRFLPLTPSRLLLLLGLGVACFLVPPTLGGGTNDPKPPPPPRAGAEALGQGKEGAVSNLYRQRCAKCHGADGAGSDMRDSMPGIPDFTSRKWQNRRSKAQLLASILDGRGTQMPPFRERLSDRQAQDLVDRGIIPQVPEPLPQFTP